MRVIALFDVKSVCQLIGEDHGRVIEGHRVLVEVDLGLHWVPLESIATSSPRVNVDFFVEHLGLERWFTREGIVYDDGSFPGKPAPDIYEIAAARLGLPPAACVVIEDAISGIEAARRAGCGRVIAIGGAAGAGAGVDVALTIERLDQLPLSWLRAR